MIFSFLDASGADCLVRAATVRLACDLMDMYVYHLPCSLFRREVLRHAWHDLGTRHKRLLYIQLLRQMGYTVYSHQTLTLVSLSGINYKCRCRSPSPFTLAPNRLINGTARLNPSLLKPDTLSLLPTTFPLLFTHLHLPVRLTAA
jgi:hypothetical protein